MKKYSNKHGYLITIISLMLCSFFLKKDFDFFNFIGYFIGILIIAIFISSIISSFVNFKYFGKVIGITSVFISIFLLLPHINNQSIKSETDNSEKEKSYIHILEKPYDSLANIFNEKKYVKKDILKIINEFGPMSFRKENNIWYIYRFDNTFVFTGSRFKLFRVPLDSVYKYKNEKQKIKNTFFYIDPLGNKSKFFIDFTSKLRNIYSATGINYDFKKNTFKNYELSEIVRIDDFGFDIKDKDTIDFIKGSAMVYNTTRKNIKNIKLKISLYDSFVDGKLISENTFLITDTLNKRELKILNINFKPQKKFKSDIVSAVNIKIINYDEF